MLGNLAGVKGLSEGELTAVAGGGFAGVFPNWYPPTLRKCRPVLVQGKRRIRCEVEKYYPALR